MSVKQKILHELKEILWISFYFLCWFGTLMLLKVLLLDEYKIEVNGTSMVILGALIAAKSVIILRNIPLLKNKPAWLSILLRTLLYSFGIFVLLLLEKGFEARHEYDGFFPAVKNILKSSDDYHIWIDTICVFCSLLFFNFGTIVKRYLGNNSFLKILGQPVPEK